MKYQLRIQFTLGLLLVITCSVSYAQTSFSNQIIIDGTKQTTADPRSVYSVDIDGDGDVDVLSASSADDKIAWYENTTGTGVPFKQHIITTLADMAWSVYAADLDGDGDPDVLSASSDDDKIAWYENDGVGGFGGQQVITTSADYTKSVYAADLDGDGDMDVLSASNNDNKIAWYENTDGSGTFGLQNIITTSANGARSVSTADLDDDGDMDVLSASWHDDKIAWYENTDGSGTFGPQKIITTSANGAESVYATDLDGDGDIDVLSISSVDKKIAWYENTTGTGSLFIQHIITTLADGGWSVYSDDIDGDGDMDVLSASSGDVDIAWYENTDGAGTFGPEQIITTSLDGANNVFAADLDGDGDMDVLSASWKEDKIVWHENTDGKGTFGSWWFISPSIPIYGPESVYSVDIDNDGDMDVLTASSGDNKIAWYENTDGTGTFGSQQIITTSADYAKSVYAADLDNDGDFDVLSASNNDNKIAWYENIDGSGTFGLQNIITTSADGAMSVYAADLDEDGDMDVLSASFVDGKIAWYENTDGAGTFELAQIITTFLDGAKNVYAADLDDDGDMDVLSASFAWPGESKIAWYENIDGTGKFGSEQIITNSVDGARNVYAVDLDNDGDMDILTACWHYDISVYDYIAWYENTDGAGTFGSEQIITTSTNLEVVYAADLDNDGDTDILSASGLADGKIAWYENGGAGGFGGQQVITTSAVWARSVHAADLDGDGDMDVLSACWGDGKKGFISASLENNKIAWYRNNSGAISIFGSEQIITTSADGANVVYAADLDNDGDMDVLSASRDSDEIAWYENTDGSGTFGSPEIITTSADGAEDVYAADLDGDGDMDVLSASWFDDKIAWYENLDGAGSFGPQQVITTSADGAVSVYAADMDGDGDMDVLSASSEDDKIATHENTDGKGNFVLRRVITTSTPNPLPDPESIYAFDWDNDGDMDVLAAFSFSYPNPVLPGVIGLNENQYLGLTFGPTIVISYSVSGPVSVYATDLDGDGDMDVLSASKRDDKICWFERSVGGWAFGSQQVITNLADGANDVYAADLNNDGDMDVLSASTYDNKIAFYDNIIGATGAFGPQQIITTSAMGAEAVFAADLDNDGDIDVLSASSDDDKIAWYPNLLIKSSIENWNKPNPIGINMCQNFPNPFNPITNIQFNLPKQAKVKISVFDLTGRLIVTLVDTHYIKGTHTVTFDGSALPSGMYIYRIETGSFTESRKMLLMK